MWNLFIRLGMVLSTVLIAKQVMDHFWPNDIHPTRVYRANQVARYLGVTTKQVTDLVQSGDLPAKWVQGEPVILGMTILNFLSRT